MLTHLYSVFSPADAHVVTVAGKKLIQPCNRSGRERETHNRWVLCVLQVYRSDSSVVKALTGASEDLSSCPPAAGNLGNPNQIGALGFCLCSGHGRILPGRAETSAFLALSKDG